MAEKRWIEPDRPVKKKNTCIYLSKKRNIQAGNCESIVFEYADSASKCQ